jgi:hypothetical protein
MPYTRSASLLLLCLAIPGGCEAVTQSIIHIPLLGGKVEQRRELAPIGQAGIRVSQLIKVAVLQGLERLRAEGRIILEQLCYEVY